MLSTIIHMSREEPRNRSVNSMQSPIKSIKLFGALNLCFSFQKRNKFKDNKSASKRGLPCTRGTAMSFGFRRRPTSGIPMPVSNYMAPNESATVHQRSKSAGPEQNRKRDDETAHLLTNNSSSGRSTPRLVPSKKESSGNAARTNRFGYRQAQQARFASKDDICSSHSASHYNQDKLQQQQQENHSSGKHHSSRGIQAHNTAPATKHRPAPMNNALPYGNSNPVHAEADRRPTGIPEPVNRYTLHTSHLPLPQYAVRMKDANSKIAKTATNQSRKVSATSKGNFKEDSGIDDSGVSSQLGYPAEKDRTREYDYYNGGVSDRRRVAKPRNIRMMGNGKSFDVRDVRDEDNTVTEISVIPLQKAMVNPNFSAATIRERGTMVSQRIIDKDNRYTDLTMSMSTTSSEGYDERSGEEKVYKDRSRTEKVPSNKSDVSPLSSDDPEYGHGEAMADEYSLSSSDECHHCKSSMQSSKASSNSSKNGTLPKNTLRTVLLNIEDPAFAAVAATSTTLIDDETSPVDSLLDSPTNSITQSDCKVLKKDCAADEPDVAAEEESPETPTNTSNSLSLSEGREFFDDEIADQPGLIFDDNSRAGAEQTSVASHVAAENSHTLVESVSKTNAMHGKATGKSPLHGQRISRTGSVDTLSPCESIDSDDLMLDYERSDTSSHEGNQRRLDPNPPIHEMDDTTLVSELEVRGEEVLRQWSLLLGTAQSQQQVNFNTVNNNVTGTSADNNNHQTSESGIGSGRTSRHLRSRSGIESPRSLDSMRNNPASSPLKTSRNIHSPNVDSGDEGSIRIERGTYQYMFQDIVSIKTMLLKLKRVLQETETVGVFNNSAKNGIFYNINEGGTVDVSTSPDSGGSSIADELADLRRQVVFLQGQVEDRDRTIQGLQFQVSKLQGSNGIDSQTSALSLTNSNISSVDTCNAATQTEKARAVSAGPSLLQSLPQDGIVTPLVSWSDSWDNQPPTPLTELSSNRRHHKPTDHLPRMKPRQGQTPNRSNGHIEKLSLESPSTRGTLRTKSSILSKSTDLHNTKKYETITVDNPLKSIITTPKRITTSTLIPRTAKTLPFSNRSHNI